MSWSRGSYLNELQCNRLTLRLARALIRYRVRKRLADYRNQNIWRTSFFVDRLDLAAEVFDYQSAQKPDGTYAEIDELIAIAREEFIDFVLVEDKRRQIELSEGQRQIVCETCSRPYDPSGQVRCFFCGYPNAFQVARMELNALADQVEPNESDPIARRVLAETEDLILEASYRKIVTCFETFHRRLNKLAFIRAGEQPISPCRLSLFQNISDTQRWFRKHHNLDNYERLSEEEVWSLDRVFNKRHVIIHNGGLIDERYIKRTNADHGKIGTPVGKSRQEVLRAIRLVERIVQTTREAFI